MLVVHLKRFQFTKYWRDKIESLVDFPEVLDMTAYTSAVDPDCPPIYSLYAVSVRIFISLSLSLSLSLCELIKSSIKYRIRIIRAVWDSAITQPMPRTEKTASGITSTTAMYPKPRRRKSCHPVPTFSSMCGEMGRMCPMHPSSTLRRRSTSS